MGNVLYIPATYRLEGVRWHIRLSFLISISSFLSITIELIRSDIELYWTVPFSPFSMIVSIKKLLLSFGFITFSHNLNANQFPAAIWYRPKLYELNHSNPITLDNHRGQRDASL